MKLRESISAKRLFLLLLIVASIYFWILIPAVTTAVTFSSGLHEAANVYSSLVSFEPVDWLWTEPDKRPSDLKSAIFYYGGPGMELVAFIVGLGLARCIWSKNKLKTKCLVCLLSICILPVLVTIAGDDFNEWVMGVLICLAVLSALVIGGLSTSIKPSANNSATS